MSQKTTQIGIIFDLDGTLLDSSDFFLKDIPKKIADYYGVEFSPLKQEKIANLFFESGLGGMGRLKYQSRRCHVIKGHPLKKLYLFRNEKGFLIPDFR